MNRGFEYGRVTAACAVLTTAISLFTAAVVNAGIPAPAATGESTPSSVTTADLEYPTGHGPGAMTVYSPAGRASSSAAQAIVMVHGGAWAQGSRALLDEEARKAAAEGFVVFNIDYELAAPRNPRQHQDVTAAIDYIHAHADDFGIAADRIGGLGTSAGAHLLMQAVTAGHAPLKAVVGWSGPYDLTVQSTPKDSALSIAAAAVHLGCVPTIGPCAELAADASPIRHVSAGNPPVLLFNSADEFMPVEQMTAFADRLRSVGTPAETRVIPGSKHAVAYSDAALAPTLAFLQQRL
ncbi:alpha/beta hydrolase [Rhodococcus sp. MTM3W5.2]|uniref:alpha/beta hydrolase n=1 Tax=Rhodococcus sp. MTM3W5.2 TaxID=1805827 RepID=UPI001671FDDA|nr:alpha/beta hydrolase [Rhodococcus sp. MTM3W5.2]